MDNLDIFTKKLIDSNSSLKEAFEVIAENQYNNDTSIIKNKIKSLGFNVRIDKPLVVFTYLDENINLQIKKQINKANHFNIAVTFKAKKSEEEDELISIRCNELIEFTTDFICNSILDSYIGFKDIVDFKSHYIGSSEALKESKINKEMFCFLINNIDKDLNSLFDMININFDVDIQSQEYLKKVAEVLLKMEETIKKTKFNTPSTKVKMKTT